MKITSATNPVFSNAANTAINLTLDTDKHGVIPFTASNADTEARGKDLFNRALAGEFGVVAPFVPRAPTQSEIDAAALNAEKQTVKTNPEVAALLIMSANNHAAAVGAANTLPALKAEVARLALIVNILAKREFK